MSEELKKKFSEEVESCDWSMLEQHHQRGAAFLVQNSVDLFDAAVALATDDVQSVKNWQTSGELRAPKEEEVNDWAKTPHQKLAKFLIVQPFVLFQLDLDN